MIKKRNKKGDLPSSELGAWLIAIAVLVVVVLIVGLLILYKFPSISQYIKHALGWT